MVGRDLAPLGVLGGLRSALAQAGGQELTDRHLINWADGAAQLRHAITGAVEAQMFDTLVWSSLPTGQSSPLLSDDVLPDHIHVIGDAYAPRDAAAAIFDAHELGRLLWH